MEVWLHKCTRCDHRFEIEFIDEDDPAERDLPRSYGRSRCPECGSVYISKLKFLGKRPLHLSQGRSR
jgi:DNA-directed RNA polymerase subunit RPC12/RpoP